MGFHKTMAVGVQIVSCNYTRVRQWVDPHAPPARLVQFKPDTCSAPTGTPCPHPSAGRARPICQLRLGRHPLFQPIADQPASPFHDASLSARQLSRSTPTP